MTSKDARKIRANANDGGDEGVVLAAVAVASATVCLLALSPPLRHWFVLPVALCGVLAGVDGVRWLRGRLDVFDPGGLIGLLGIHFFFLAPLLLVAWDSGVQGWNVTLSDWRPWLGSMACLNAVGLLIYHGILRLGPSHGEWKGRRSVWKLHRRRFPAALGIAVTLSVALQAGVYAQFGGIAGYVDAVTDLQTRAAAFQGLGPVFMLSESAPLLGFMAFVLSARRHRLTRTWPALLFALSIFALLEVFFGGLRGSRSTSVWALFWAVGLVHLCVRPIPRRIVVSGLIFVLLPFMYFYGFFKAGGVEGLTAALSGSVARSELERSSGRSVETLMFADLSRSDVQALVLERLWDPSADGEYAWGETYLASVALVIPKVAVPEPLEGKVARATDLVFGKGAYATGVLASSKVYGLAGEAMLNFGPFAVPLSFIPLALLVRGIRRRSAIWRGQRDARALMLPMLVSLCLVMLVSDSDNLIFFTIKTGMLPFTVILLGSIRRAKVRMDRRVVQGSTWPRTWPSHREFRECGSRI
jgi:hypothetical protein